LGEQGGSLRAELVLRATGAVAAAAAATAAALAVVLPLICQYIDLKLGLKILSSKDRKSSAYIRDFDKELGAPLVSSSFQDEVHGGMRRQERIGRTKWSRIVKCCDCVWPCKTINKFMDGLVGERRCDMMRTCMRG